MSQFVRALVGTLLLALVLTATAGAFRLGDVELRPVPGNPAHALAGLKPDAEEYDPATRCLRTRRPGVERLLRWLDTNAAGVSWGTYRCERWGRRSASLHAEGRAIDWHLDSRDPAQRAAGRKLIRLLLAPDTAGTPHALARRMGIQELIWDCSYWGAGAEDFGPYAPCYGKDRRTRRRRVDATVGHLDHLHIGLTKAGAMGRTSFWTR
jgi:hypothetical protein